MAAYRQVFVITDVALVHERYLIAIRDCERVNQVARKLGIPQPNIAVIARLRGAYQEFQDGLVELARVTSLSARQQIIDKLRVTQRREDTGVSPHLRDNIVCRALPPLGSFQTGAVGIADEEQLNRTPYWIAQEEGTGVNGVGSIVGHVLRGYFYGTGYTGAPTPPQPGIGTQPVFWPGAPRTGQKDLPYGIGVVQREIQGRHFIRDGAQAAEALWKARINALQAAQVGTISGLI